MEKLHLVLIIICIVILVTMVTLGVVLSFKQASSIIPLTPKQECNSHGYIWNPDTDTCTSLTCVAKVDPSSGAITGQVLNSDGDKCVAINEGAYLTAEAQASLLQLCQSTACTSCPNANTTKFTNLTIKKEGPFCIFPSGCALQPYTYGSIMDGCPFMTYQSDGNNCVAPVLAQLKELCEVSVNGCPLNSNLNLACSQDTPCFNPGTGCVAKVSVQGVSVQGCRPMNQNWTWDRGECVDATVSNTIGASVVSADVNQIQGTFELNNIPTGVKLMWNFVLTDNDTKTWQGPMNAFLENNTFVVPLEGLNIPANVPYSFDIQVYTYTNDTDYVLKFVTSSSTTVTLNTAPAPVSTGLQSIIPNISIDEANTVASNVGVAIATANSNSDNTNPNPFNNPSTDVWTNSLQGLNITNYLIVPCTSAYCSKTELGVATVMFILAWKSQTSLTTEQLNEIKKTCPLLTNPQISYAVYRQKTSDFNSELQLVKDKLSENSWVQPLSSDATITWLFRIVAYVWSTSDPGIEQSNCKSVPLDVPVQVPLGFYNAGLCFNITPLKPQGAFMPGNFMVYHAGDNMCSSPSNLAEVLGARDFSCLTSNSQTPLLENMMLYACNDVEYDSNCNSSGQGCQTVTPIKDVRVPLSTDVTGCLPPLDNPSCGGYQYCQVAACNCPASVEWANCGSNVFAKVGENAAIEESNWKIRVNNVVDFVTHYKLDTLDISTINIQKFLNQLQSSEALQTAWDTTYGPLNTCPLPKWKTPADQKCDITNTATACQQNLVCNDWELEPATKGLYKQEIVQFPSSSQGSACCGTGNTYLNGCCCPNFTTNECAGLTNCTPVIDAISTTWCHQ